MSNEQIIVDIENLSKVNSTILGLIQDVGAHIDDLLLAMKALGAEWNDEDFENLIKLLNEFYVEFEKLNSNGTHLAQKALEKINQIRSIQNLTI